MVAQIGNCAQPFEEIVVVDLDIEGVLIRLVETEGDFAVFLGNALDEMAVAVRMSL